MTASKHDHVYQMENRIIFISSSISDTSNKGVFLGPNGFASTFSLPCVTCVTDEPNLKKKKKIQSHPGHHLQFSFHYYLPRINTLEKFYGSLSSY